MKNIKKIIFGFLVLVTVCMLESCGALKYAELEIFNKVEAFYVQDLTITWQGPEKEEKIYIDYLGGGLSSQLYCIPVAIEIGNSTGLDPIPFTISYKLNDVEYSFDCNSKKAAYFAYGDSTYIEIEEDGCVIHNQFYAQELMDSKD